MLNFQFGKTRFLIFHCNITVITVFHISMILLHVLVLHWIFAQPIAIKCLLLSLLPQPQVCSYWLICDVSIVGNCWWYFLNSSSPVCRVRLSSVFTAAVVVALGDLYGWLAQRRSSLDWCVLVTDKRTFSQASTIAYLWIVDCVVLNNLHVICVPGKK